MVKNHALTSGVPHINLEILKGFAIPLPPLPVQHHIVSVLSAYDDLIENNLRRMALLEESARLLYREWFVRLHFPGYEHTRIVNSVPEGWERAPLEYALVLQRGFDLPSQNRQEGPVPVYASTGSNGYHDKAMVKGPGVVTGRSGTLGVVHYISEDFWPLNTTLWVREFKRVTPIYAFFLLQELKLEQYNGGVSVPTLDRKVVHRVPILIPSEKLLSVLSEYVEPIFTQITNLKLQNQKLKAARDLLLPRLMSGEIAV
jgi:type I restriction enzyme S subunit